MHIIHIYKSKYEYECKPHFNETICEFVSNYINGAVAPYHFHCH